jgi:rubrerythrin
MGEFESIGEILEFAVAREVAAKRFYKDLAEKVENPAMRELLAEFAKEELQHKEKLELEMMKEGIVVATGEKVAGLRGSDYIVDVESTADMDYKELLALAIKKEKLSVRLYVDLAAMVDDAEWREMLLCLAEEEAGHKARFEIEYEEFVLKGH